MLENVLSKLNFYQNMSEKDKSVGTQINELIIIRDFMCSDFNLNRSEICNIIEYLATCQHASVIYFFNLFYFYALLLHYLYTNKDYNNNWPIGLWQCTEIE